MRRPGNSLLRDCFGPPTSLSRNNQVRKCVPLGQGPEQIRKAPKIWQQPVRSLRTEQSSPKYGCEQSTVPWSRSISGRSVTGNLVDHFARVYAIGAPLASRPGPDTQRNFTAASKGCRSTESEFGQGAAIDVPASNRSLQRPVSEFIGAWRGLAVTSGAPRPRARLRPAAKRP
jgi:hypothetical protein